MLGVIHLIVSVLGVLGWFAGYYIAAFCGDGIEYAPRCDHARSMAWQPIAATAVSGLVALIVVLRARQADARTERQILVALSVVSATVMIALVVWYFHVAASATAAAPPA